MLMPDGLSISETAGVFLHNHAVMSVSRAGLIDDRVHPGQVASVSQS